MSIEVQDITKQYGNQKALNGVSFSICRGEIAGFLGPNGAGKSTMMKILTCYIPQNSGKAKVYGLDVEEHSIEIRKRVGYLPEHNPLYLDMYAKEYLSFIADVHKVPKSRVNEMIDRVGLIPESHKKLGHLSKGYRQRAGLAAALLHDPKVLILDEPTTGLDPNQLVEIRDLIREIGQKKTVMLSTHIMQEVEILCNRVIIINKGSIVADRPIAELKSTSKEKAFLIEFDKPFTLNSFKGVQGVKRLEKITDKRIRVFSEPGIDVRNELFRYAVEQKMNVLEMRQEEQSLENIFHSLTQN